MRPLIARLLVWSMRVVIVLMTVAVFTTALSEYWGELRQWFFRNPDKVLHFVGMFLFTLGAMYALPAAPVKVIWTSMIGLAGAVELVQIAGPRSADWADFCFSAAGVLTVALAYYGPRVRGYLVQWTRG